MSITTVRRRRRGARRLVRAGAVGLAVLASSAVGLPSAAGAVTVTIPLAPPEVGVLLYPVENTGPLTVEGEGDPFAAGTPVDVEWTGGVVVQLPAPLDGGAMDVSLKLMPTEDGTPTRIYSTTSAAPDALVVTDLGNGRYGVTLPADDSTGGPFGALSFDNVGSAGPGIEVINPVDYLLEFTGTGVSLVDLAPQILAFAQVPCPMSSMSRCPAIPVDAGAQFGITVPPTSLLRTLGLGTLDDLVLGLDKLDAHGVPVDDETIMLTDDPALVTVSDPYNATVTLPASTPGGSYGLTVVQATGTAGSISITFGELKVTNVPTTAPTPRIVNAGLRSNTGWGEEQVSHTGGGVSPMVGVGGGMVLIAGGGAGLVLRRRPAKD